MGYELSIKRKDENNKITKEQWAEYMKIDSDFEPIEEYSTEFNEGDTLTIAIPNPGLWKSDKGEVPFTFYEEYGEITVKNPNNSIIEKMVLISNKLNAIVEGEIYDDNYLKDIFSNPSNRNSSSVDKKWWQFWK